MIESLGSWAVDYAAQKWNTEKAQAAKEIAKNETSEAIR